jgi:hypothetical protein
MPPSITDRCAARIDANGDILLTALIQLHLLYALYPAFYTLSTLKLSFVLPRAQIFRPGPKGRESTWRDEGIVLSVKKVTHKLAFLSVCSNFS